MHNPFFIVSFLQIAFDMVTAQTSGMANGQYYLCIQAGRVCPTASATIDPRIVTPGVGTVTTVCPAGTYACFGRTIPCGTRLVASNMTTAGLAPAGAYPWQAYLRTTTFAGSGVLISPYYVLTAAHKVCLFTTTPNVITVQMGVTNPNVADVYVQSSTVASIRLHPSFNSCINPTSYPPSVNVSLRDDIAVLQLTQPMVVGIYSNINTICLPPSATTSYVGSNGCYVSGWGVTNFTLNDAPNAQKQVGVPIVNYTTCYNSFLPILGNVNAFLDSQGEICAGGQQNMDACSQDGGSPLVCPGANGAFTVVGLVIWGKNCGRPGVYGVYVNVAYYLTWIQSQTPAIG